MRCARARSPGLDRAASMPRSLAWGLCWASCPASHAPCIRADLMPSTIPELAAFHIAYLVQPEALDKAVFNAYYVRRTKPIKQSAAALGISDRHFYRLLGEFRVRVYASSKVILRGNEAAREALPHHVGGA